MHAADDSIAEAADMEVVQLGDLTVDTDGVAIADVARIVRERSGLLPVR